MTVEAIANRLRGDVDLGYRFVISIQGFTIGVSSNSEALIQQLTSYFSHLVVNAERWDCQVEAIEGSIDLSDEGWTDWPREAGKSGRKEAYIDGENFRLIHKIKTGIYLLQSSGGVIIRGHCSANDNQVINAINAQFLNHRQHQGDQLCHASACQLGDTVAAFAGFSGGGKSTLMLHCLDAPELSYLSNDRLLLERRADTTIARGIPKLPRVNPGTIVNDFNLRSMLNSEELARYEELPANELWDLEDKFDVRVDQVYGQHRLAEQGNLGLLCILNWQRNSEEDTEVRSVIIEQRADLLAAVMKSSGPFYLDIDGSPLSPNNAPIPERYLHALAPVDVYEISGRIDFQAAKDQVVALLRSLSP